MQAKKCEIHYICFYSDNDVKDKLITYPSVLSKIDYIVLKLKQCGLKVNLVSISPSKSGYFRGRQFDVDNLEKHVYFSSLFSCKKILSRFMLIWNWIRIVIYLLTTVKNNDVVLVYHSLYHRYWLKAYHCLFRKRFILEVEDVYSSLSDKTRMFKRTEWELINMADACICVNDIIKNAIPKVPLKIISYGSYLLPKKIDVQKSTTIKLIYAGVIEQERNAAFLAVEAMRFLPDGYELHICGFGNKENVDALCNRIREIERKSHKSNIFFHGMKTGDAYLRILQSCDIALSTHKYTQENMESADYTFPSKVLVYLANGLRVIAQNIDCLTKSQISDLLYYYDRPTPECLAKNIKAIPLENGNNKGRQRIYDMDVSFGKELKKLILDVSRKNFSSNGE